MEHIAAFMMTEKTVFWLDMTKKSDVRGDMVNDLPASEVLFPEMLQRILTVRKHLGLSERSVEALADVSRGTIGRLRNGEGGNYDTITKLNNWSCKTTEEIRGSGVSLGISDPSGMSIASEDQP